MIGVVLINSYEYKISSNLNIFFIIKHIWLATLLPKLQLFMQRVILPTTTISHQTINSNKDFSFKCNTSIWLNLKINKKKLSLPIEKITKGDKNQLKGQILPPCTTRGIGLTLRLRYVKVNLSLYCWFCQLWQITTSMYDFRN